MTLTMRPCQDEGDYFRVRNFLREVFLLNNRPEHSWQRNNVGYLLLRYLF